ncbi:MAG: ADP-dependent glucokinase/phosphofructokinase [Cellulomonas sp.]|nr:ADP-dependent glucokinase/phosphofructokinase [Cellulomonas sp.]
MKHAVLGLGGTVDYEIVWDTATLQALVDELGLTPADLDLHHPVRTERDLVISIVSFVAAGVGGERFVASSAVIDAFAARFATAITLGGTGVRAGIAMAAFGLPSTVHLVSIDDHVRRLLPPQISSVCSAEQDSLDPHLIVQYPAGVRLRVGDRELVSTEPNRLIYAHDPPNAELVLAEGLGEELARADLFLICGFNTVRDRATLETRLDDLRRHLKRLPEGALVIYEDAGFHVPALSDLVRERLLDAIDLYGMNEDEMQAYLGVQVDLLDAEAMADHLVALHARVPARTLMVHSRSWALAYGPDARRWRDALRGGVVMAGARYALGDGFAPVDHARIAAGPVSAGGAAFADRLGELLGDQVCAVPALDLRVERPTTIGLGDTFMGGLVAELVMS